MHAGKAKEGPRLSAAADAAMQAAAAASATGEDEGGKKVTIKTLKERLDALSVFTRMLRQRDVFVERMQKQKEAAMARGVALRVKGLDGEAAYVDQGNAEM